LREDFHGPAKELIMDFNDLFDKKNIPSLSSS